MTRSKKKGSRNIIYNIFVNPIAQWWDSFLMQWKRHPLQGVFSVRPNIQMRTSAEIRIRWCRWPDSNRHGLPRRILSYSSHSEPNGLNRNKTVFSVTFQNIKNPKKPYKISIFDAKHQKYKQFVPSSIIGNQIPNLRRWRDVGGM